MLVASDWTCASCVVFSVSKHMKIILTVCELVPERASCGACLNASQLSFLQCLLKMISKQVLRINVFSGITEKNECSLNKLPLLLQWLLCAYIFFFPNIQGA